MRHWHAPFQIAGDGAVTQAVPEIGQRKVADVGAPVLLSLDPSGKGLFEGAELQEEVRGVPEFRRVAVEAAADVDEVLGVHGFAAAIALVAPRRVIAAMGAGSLDVAVRQEALVHQRVGHGSGLLVEVALLKEFEEDLVGRIAMVVRAGASKQVERDAQAAQAVEEFGLLAFHDFLGALAGFLGGDGDGRAVLVAAGDHEHVVSLHPVVTGKDIRRQESPGDVAEMERAVCVGPGDPDKDTLGHGVSRTGQILALCRGLSYLAGGWHPPASVRRTDLTAHRWRATLRREASGRENRAILSSANA